MQYRKLGSSGLKISALSYGSWLTFGQMDPAQSKKLMEIAYDHGVNFFDNAEAYAAGKSETIMGQHLKSLSWGRDTYCVSSKVFWGGELPTQLGLSRKHIVDACHAALTRLQVDYLDLYFCHRPDPDTPIHEIVHTMHNLITQGKVLYWGTSEWSGASIQEAIDFANKNSLIAPTMEQPQYNMFERHKVEEDYLPIYQGQGLGTTIWSPLASGVLAGKYLDGVPDDSRFGSGANDRFREGRLDNAQALVNMDKARKLKTLADKMGMPLSQLSLGWCLQNPHVSSVILGATKEHQLIENLKTLDILEKITPEVMQSIQTIIA